jgi:WD40 repeat protein
MFLIKHSDPIFSICLKEDENRLISASRDKTVRIWNLESGHHLDKIELENEPTKIELYEKEKIIVGLLNGSIEFYCLSNGQILKKWKVTLVKLVFYC